jgi:hypothetical protein
MKEKRVNKCVADFSQANCGRVTRERYSCGFLPGSPCNEKEWLKGIQPHSFVPRTTDSRYPYPISLNLLLDRPLPVGPNQVWVGDITYSALR